MRKTPLPKLENSDVKRKRFSEIKGEIAKDESQRIEAAKCNYNHIENTIISKRHFLVGLKMIII